MSSSTTLLTSLQGRDQGNCRAPGAYKCAVIVQASLISLGVKGSTTGNSGVQVVGGSCDNIIASGELQRNSPGFSADYTTTYGSHLYFGASSIGIGNIRGLEFQYNGASYTQGDCFGADGSSGLRAVDIVQCDFDC
jgi:hypothetical protein